MAESDHLTIVEAARLCGVDPRTIQWTIHTGRLPAEYPQTKK